MKVSKTWLQQLVDLKVSMKEVESLLPLRTIATKEITDDFIELDMKGYNRADLLSMRGVAREVAAITDSKITFDDQPFPKYNLPEIPVVVENEGLTPVYCLAKIEGLKVEPSSPDWVKKLADSGIRSINNVADVTNLIMLEYGQPLHAFDSEKVSGKVGVRVAKSGEKITTLDGKPRNLEPTDLLITDEDKTIGIAGVMGGENTEVSNSTSTILLEAAIFDSKNIRRTAQRLGLHSEASRRFQHGLTKTNLLAALSAAIRMYQDLGGKLTALNLVGDLEDKPKTVKLTQEKVNSLIGIDIPIEQIESSLKKLGFSLGVISRTPPRWDVTIPYWRLDINIEEDLVEEMARMYGYEKIPAKELKGELPQRIDQSLFELIYSTKRALADAGLTEVQTYSFYSIQTLSTLHFPLSTLVNVANPISSETEYLRNNIWPNLVEVVSKNMRQGYEDIAVFEIGKVYLPPSPSLRAKRSNLPRESYRLAIALMNGTTNPVEELTSISLGVKLIHPPGVQIEKSGMTKEELEDLFHPTRFTTVKDGEKVIGSLAEVHPRFLNNLGIEKRVAILEIILDTKL